MEAFINSVKAVSRLCGIIAATLVLLAILVVCQMVFMRYVLNASTVWQTEFVIFSLVGATLIGSPYVLLIKGHVNVDLLPLYLGRRGRFALALLANFGGLAFCALLGWMGYRLFDEALTKNWHTDTVWSLPLWIPYISFPIGIGLLCLQYVADILALASGREMPFDIPNKDHETLS
ncbi:MAG: TRAP transporter small permease [Rhodospirillales bacterium]|nr:TRAP transporter small permease [Rhodospirillales bacterium]